MPNRILREGINDSEAVNALSEGAELFYRKLMSIVDDFGRCEANPSVLRGKLYALRPERTPEDVARFLAECSEGEEPLVTVYVVGRKKYLQINNFGQRERTQKYPPPPPLRTNGGNPPQTAAYARAAGHARPDAPNTNTHSHTHSYSQEEGSRGETNRADAEESLVALGEAVGPRNGHRAHGAERKPPGATGKIPNCDSALERICEAYPAEGWSPPEEAKPALRAALREGASVPLILAAIKRYQAEDFRWQTGRVHSLKNFLGNGLWRQKPLPVANGVSARRSKTAGLEARLAELKGRPPPGEEHAAGGNGSGRKPAGGER